MTQATTTLTRAELPPLDDSGKLLPGRLLYLGTCRRANSHNSALCGAPHKADEQIFDPLPGPVLFT